MLAMFKILRSLIVVSRPEFLLAMASWFIIGLSWSLNQPTDLALGLLVPATLSFAIVMLNAAIGLQINNIFDYDLDRKDIHKKPLVQAMESLGVGRLKLFMTIEFLLSLAFIFLLGITQGKPALLLMWIVGVFLAYAYSAPPVRLKSRCWMSLGSLLLIICILPALFVYYTFTYELSPLFLLFLAGQSMSVYSLVLSTEIRDYFEDKAMNVGTMTVRLGLDKASFSSIVLLGAGGLLTITAFFLELFFTLHPTLNIFLLVIAIADYAVLKRLKKLHSLSREYMTSKGQDFTAGKIKRFSENSTRWIALASQATVFMSIVLLVSRFLP